MVEDARTEGWILSKARIRSKARYPRGRQRRHYGHAHASFGGTSSAGLMPLLGVAGYFTGGGIPAGKTSFEHQRPEMSTKKKRGQAQAPNPEG